jgi:type I restriction enzyme R subunit
VDLLFFQHLGADVHKVKFPVTSLKKKEGQIRELIREILNGEVKVRTSRNLVKYRKLKESVEKIIADYHHHFFDSLIALEKCREVNLPLYRT